MSHIWTVFDRPWAPFVVLPLVTVVVGAGIWVLHLAFPPALETRTVVKICRDGTLVIRRPDGEFRIVRPGYAEDWPAVGPEVCQ